MKLYINKDKCHITEDINGSVIIVETYEPVLIEEYSSQQLLHSSADTEFGFEDKPFLTIKPDKFAV